MKFTTASEVDLGHEKVGKLLFMLAVPAILSQIVNLLGSLTLAHSQNSQMSFMYGFFFVKFLFLLLYVL